VSRFNSEALRFAAGTALIGLAVIALTSCELATVTVPKTDAGVVVHAVLSTTAANQVVLVERTLSGAANIPDT